MPHKQCKKNGVSVCNQNSKIYLENQTKEIKMTYIATSYNFMVAFVQFYGTFTFYGSSSYNLYVTRLTFVFIYLFIFFFCQLEIKNQ